MKKFIVYSFLSFFAINMLVAQNATLTNAVNELMKDEQQNVKAKTEYADDIVICKEKQKKAPIEIIISEDAVFTETENEETKQFYLLYPGFPKYINTGDKEQDIKNYEKAVNEWISDNPEEFEKIFEEQLRNQQIENDNSKIKKQ